MSWVLLVIAVVVLVLPLGWWCRRVEDNPRGDLLSGVLLSINRVYCAAVHRLRIEGREHIPRSARLNGRPVVIVANHTSGVDPLLIQSALEHVYVRWLMAEDMRGPETLQPVWDFAGLIMVNRHGRAEIIGMRSALRALASGEVVGVFPEGRLQRRRGVFEEFLPGAGVLIARSGALVVPVFIDGTPFDPTAWGAVLRPSRSRVRFLPPVDYRDSGMTSRQIADDLKARLIAQASNAD